MLKIYDKVKIKSNDICGTIVDIYTINDRTKFVVESDTPNVDDGYGGKWKLFDCDESNIILIKTA